MRGEETLYPTDVLKSKYVTVLQASMMCKTTIPRIIEMINSKAIPYAEFKVDGKRSRVVHVNYEDVERVLASEEGVVS